MTEQSSQPRLTLEELKNAAWYVPQHRSDGWRAYHLAHFVLRRFLGQEWINRAFTSVSGDGFGFLNPDGFGQSSDDFSIHIHRVIDLAEDLFNLQDVDGFSSPLAQLETGKNAEPSIAELEVAGVLKKLDVAFRFVVPLGKRGENYDLEITFPDGRVALADTKCKVEGTPLGQATISHTLSETPSQFPPDKPSIVFLKAPHAWLTRELGVREIHDIMTKAAYRFLGATTRVVSIKYFFRNLIRTPHGLVYSTFKYKEITNIKSPLASVGSWDLLRPLTQESFDAIEAGEINIGPRAKSWTCFGEVCDETDLSKMCPAVIVGTFSPE